MKKKILGYVVVLVILVIPALSLAAEFRSGDQPAVGNSEQIANDLYMAGGGITSAGNVTGDLVAGGGNIFVSGDVNADVTAGGGNVTILSSVGDDVRVVGGNIVIQGKVGGDLVAAGGQITLGGGGVAGDVAIGGGDIRIEAPVAGKMTIKAGSVFINGTIGGNVNIEADVVKLGSAAVISGDLTYKARRELEKDPAAVINGKVTFEERKGKMASPVAFAAIFSAFLIWKFFAILASAMLFGLVLRRYNMELIAYAVRRPLLEIFRGLVILIAMPIISILLVATLVGIPLGILGFIGFIAMMIFACIVTPIIIGSVVYRYLSKKALEVSWKTILIGVLVYCLLGLIPFIGWLVQFLLMMLALGSTAAFKWRILKEWR